MSTAATARRPFLRIVPERCIACGACVAVCEPVSLLLHGLELHYDAETCTSCVECFRVCPSAALVPLRGRFYRTGR